MSEARAPVFWTAWRWLLGATLAALALTYALVWARYLAFSYGVFGWAADHVLLNAWQIANGQPVYVDPASEPVTAFLYTPGLALMLAPLVAWLGPEMWIAQLVNGLAAALVVALVAREAGRRAAAVAARGGPSARLAAPFAAGLVFLAGGASLSALLWVHPETWSVAWTLLALAALGRGAPDASARAAGAPGAGVPAGRIVAAALFAVAAVATKQTALAGVAALALTLLARRVRAGLAFGAAVAAALALLFLLGERLTGGRFGDHVLLPLGQPLRSDDLPEILGWIAATLGPCLALVLPWLVLRARREGLRALLADPWTCAAPVLLLAGAAAMLKADSIPNNLLGGSVVLVPLFVEAAWELAARWGPRAGARAVASAGWRGPALAVLAAAFLYLAVRSAWRDARQLAINLEQHDARLAVAHEIEARLAAVSAAGEGPAWVAHGPLFALRAGQPVESAALLLHEFEGTAPEAGERLLRRIDAGEFAAILLPHGVFGMLPEAVWRPRLFARYRPAALLGEGVSWGVLTPATWLTRR